MVIRKERAMARKRMKPGNATELSEICAEIKSASEEVEISITIKFCQRVLYGKGMSPEWQTSGLVPIFKGKDEVRSCNGYTKVKL